MANWFRIFLFLAVFAHGVGHVLFLVPALGVAGWGQSTRSWLLTDALGDSPVRAVAAVLWLAVILAYLGGLYGYFTQAAWGPGLLVSASGLSVLGLLVFWVNTPPTLSALTFDVLLIVALQFFRWPAVA
jgi:hypothetical protein